MSKCILVTSGKGGTGKSTFTVNIGAAFASMGATTLLLDFNVGFRNLDIYLGLQNNVVFDSGDVFSGLCNIGKALIQSDVSEKLFFLPCPQGKDIRGLTPEHYHRLFDWAKNTFEYVVVDMPGSNSKDFLNIASNCDMTLLTVTPDYTSVRNNDCLLKTLKDGGMESACYVINRADSNFVNAEDLPGMDEMARVFNIPLIGVVMEDQSVNIGNNSGFPVVLDEESCLSRNFMKMAAEIARM